MIELTKLNKQRNGEKFFLNCDLIETIEEKPDTTIKLVNGKNYVVSDSAAQVISKIIAFKRGLYNRYN
ncbi:flagellar FlbD family protein [Acetobacterium tundrae]|uniref:Flagellar protein n=1 Tax=Acetobacterium tundrae TaxID=132932 RepID=A0ABR6WKP4_9FIRM|nr:flagellar FlbD family protein [Acetobacterium tundrae]MBC3797087.1 flagellar protein [Acetobacterium tundrae]